MATKIVTKNSSTASSVPTAAQLVQGELAVNVADKRLYTEDNAGAVVLLADGTKLDGIEALADVTDVTNVTAAGALMDSELTSIASVKALDQGVATTDSPTFAAIDVTGTATMDGLLVEGETAGQGASIEVHATTAEFGDALLIAKSDNASDSIHAGVKIQGSNNPFYIYQSNGSNTNKLRFNYNSMSDAGGQMTIASNGDISFYEDTGTTAKFFWDASAEALGIGTSSVDSLLHLSKASGGSIIRLENPDTGLSSSEIVGRIEFETQDNGGAGVNSYIQAVGQGSGGANQLEFGTGTSNSPSTRLVIDASGNVLVGKSASNTAVEGSELRDDGSIVATRAGGIAALLNRTSSDGEILRIAKDGTTVGSWQSRAGLVSTIILDPRSNGAGLSGGGNAIFPTSNTGALLNDHVDLGNADYKFKDAYLSVGLRGDTLKFSSNAGTERMRIDSSGRLNVGVTSGSFNARITSYSSSSYTFESVRTGTGNEGHVVFKNGNGAVGLITTNGSATAYGTSSDYRLKEDLQPMTGSIDRVKALKPWNFAWKIDGSRVDGFMAHEAQEVVANCATGTKDAMKDEEYEVTAATGDIYTAAVDAVDEIIHSSDVVEPETLEEGQQWRQTTAQVMDTRNIPDYQGIDQSKLVPLLVSALQEAIARIETLEAGE